MPMRHPLKDLSPESFLPLEHKTVTKRPLSPGAALLSPSKRRILSAEGLYSPEKKRNSASSRQLFSEPAKAPPSPARKLDFAALSHPTPCKADLRLTRDASSRPQTPVQRADDVPKLGPSPEIASSSASGTATRIGHCESTSDSSHDNNPPLPMRIPREMPVFADRHSIHWPGFDIHADTHISIPTSETITYTPDVSIYYDEDGGKENIRPRRRAGKKSAPDEGKAGKDARLSRTEHQVLGTGCTMAISTLTGTPPKKALNHDERQQERRQNRLMMVRELDQELNEEEDVEQQL